MRPLTQSPLQPEGITFGRSIMADQFEMSIRLFLEPEEEALMHAPVAAKVEDWLDRSQTIEIFSTNLGASPQPALGSDIWYQNLRLKRHDRHARWLAPMLEFSKHPGERVLGLGSTLGSDWVEYARQGAEMVVCDSDPNHMEITRGHFKSMGKSAKFVQLAGPTKTIPLASCSLDVAVVNWLNEGEPLAQELFAELFRCLKPGGKVIALAWARYSVHWRHWLKPSGVFHQITSADGRKLLEPFQETKVRRRHLRRGDMPGLLRWIPTPLVERVIGRVVVLKGFKPLTASIPLGKVA